jgi:ABC-type amino acid transport substrate-binding protein
MKNSILLGTVALMCTLQLHSLAQDSWSQIVKKGEGTLGVIYYQQPGMIQKDKAGELSGLCIDILKDFVAFVEKKYNKKIYIQYIKEEISFSAFIESIKATPNIIGIGNITITAERKKSIQFTEPYLANPVILLSHKNAPDVSSSDQIPVKFKDYSALVVNKSTSEIYINAIQKKYYPTLTIKKVGSGIELMDEMVRNPKTFGTLDLTEYIYAVRNKLPLKRHTVKISEKNEALGFGMQLNNDWQMVWKAFLTPEYKQSVNYRKHVVNNLGTSFLGLVDQ